MGQPGQFAWQIFDDKVTDLLYAEYSFHDAHFVAAQKLDELIALLEGVDQNAALRTVQNLNTAVDHSTVFDPSIKDGKSTAGLDIPKSN